MEDTEQQGPGIENGLEWSNGTVHFDQNSLTEKSGPPRKVDHFYQNFSGWTRPIHSVLDCRKFPEILVEWITPLIILRNHAPRFFSGFAIDCFQSHDHFTIGHHVGAHKIVMLSMKKVGFN